MSGARTAKARENFCRAQACQQLGVVDHSLDRAMIEAQSYSLDPAKFLSGSALVAQGMAAMRASMLSEAGRGAKKEGTSGMTFEPRWLLIGFGIGCAIYASFKIAGLAP